VLQEEAEDSEAVAADLPCGEVADLLNGEVADLPNGEVADLPRKTGRERLGKIAGRGVAAGDSHRNAVVVHVRIDAAVAAAVDLYCCCCCSLVAEVPGSDRLLQEAVALLAVLLLLREAAEQSPVAPTCAFSWPSRCSR
jgi:hypothetical protein